MLSVLPVTPRPLVWGFRCGREGQSPRTLTAPTSSPPVESLSFPTFSPHGPHKLITKILRLTQKYIFC